MCVWTVVYSFIHSFANNESSEKNLHVGFIVSGHKDEEEEDDNDDDVRSLSTRQARQDKVR